METKELAERLHDWTNGFPHSAPLRMILEEAIAALEAAERQIGHKAEEMVPFEDYRLARDALLYWVYECSGNEPSLSVFNRMVNDALTQNHTGTQAQIEARSPEEAE